ncbi:MAG: AMP-binding protein [Gemmatimonadaceae bacterium]|nr:AMP-binding protein [Gemmatimonadaceae bacterium]MCW5825745.1 AMP-binding protein [Gemmatimonadaceae bacterium]
MDLLPLRSAAAKGRVDSIPAPSLVAAGFTLLQRCPALVRALAGKRSGILLPSSPQFLTALAASDGRGAVLINPLAAPAEIAYQLQDAAVGAVFTVAALARRLPDHIPVVLLDEAPAQALFTISGGDEQRIDLGSHFGLELEGDADAPGRDEECAIVYTSAMQGTPLGAILTHRNLIANARATVQAAANEPSDHVLALLPFSHLFGLTVSLVAPLMAGARVTTMPRFNPIAAVDLIEREAITEVVGVPAIFAALLAAVARRGGKLNAPALRLCICGGAPLAPELQEQWEAATGVALRQGYGLTEASPVALFNRVGSDNVLGSLGLPFPGVRVSVRDPETSAEVPQGSVGEICVAGETVFRGYIGEVPAPGATRFGATGASGPAVPTATDSRSHHSDPTANVGRNQHSGPTPRDQSRGLRTRDGWLHSGDLGVLREDDRVEFRGVCKEMFTRNGFNIYPQEIARVIKAMPGVRDAWAYPIYEPSRENDIGVELSVDAGSKVTVADVKAWCEARLSQYKQPSRVTLLR